MAKISHLDFPVINGGFRLLKVHYIVEVYTYILLYSKRIGIWMFSLKIKNKNSVVKNGGALVKGGRDPLMNKVWRKNW